MFIPKHFLAAALGAAALLSAGHASAANIASTGVASASNSLPGYAPSLAIDGNASTSWVNGPSNNGFAADGVTPLANSTTILNGSQPWYEIDFAAPVTVSSISAIVEQFPNGFTSHHVYLDNVWTFNWSGVTTDNDTLTYSFAAPVTFSSLRIQTEFSPSWVAWSEVQVQNVSAVPEPESWAMMGLGLGLLSIAAKRKKQAR